MFMNYNISYIFNVGFVLFFLYLMQVLLGLLMSFFLIFSDNVFFNLHYYKNNMFFFDLLVFLHCNLANIIFFFIFLHIYKAFLFTDNVNMMVKFVGFIMFVVYAIICFTGYLLPNGQMSFWGGVVILNLLSVLPYSNMFLLYFFGNFSYSFMTLKRFYVVHFMVPFILFIFIFLHILLLYLYSHSHNMLINGYYNMNFFTLIFFNDLLFLFFMLIFINYFFFFKSFFFYEHINFINFNLLNTPLHMKPEWYFLFWYGVLKLFTSKVIGIMFFLLFLMLILFLLLNNFIFINFKFIYYICMFLMIMLFIYFSGLSVIYPFININILLFSFFNLFLMFPIFFYML